MFLICAFSTIVRASGLDIQNHHRLQKGQGNLVLCFEILCKCLYQASLFVVLLMPYIPFQDGSYMPFLMRKGLSNDGSSVSC